MNKELLMSIGPGGIYAIISPLRDKWKDIGQQLGLLPTTLEAIDKSREGRVDQCLYSVLTKWLQGDGNVVNKGGISWNALIQTLKCVGADDNVIAACKAKATSSTQNGVPHSDNVTNPPMIKEEEKNAKPKLRDLIHLEVTLDWYPLGLMLGLPQHVLDVIERDHANDSAMCKRKMFSKWLCSIKDCTYTSLVEALVEIKKKDVAEKVSQQFLGKSIYTGLIDQSIQSQKECSLQKSSKLLCYLRSLYPLTSKDEAEWPATVQMEYINLSLITSTKKFSTLKSVQSSIEFTKQGNVQHILEQNQPIPLADILTYDADKKVLLIEGAPGVGKTTLTNKFCSEWAKGELLKDYSLVLRFPLREPIVRIAESIEELLSYFGDNCGDEDMQYIKTTQGSKVLLILDGWDELRLSCRLEDMFFPKLVKGKILPNCSVIITSRSGSTDLIRYYAPNPRIIEVLGFTPEQIKNYIREYFKKEGTPEAGEKLLKDLEVYPNVANACYIAINLTIVCYVYCAGDYNLPPTLTEVYEAFVVHAVLRYLKKLERIADKSMPEIDQICEMEDLNDDIKTMLNNLGQLALEGLSTDDLCFPQRQLFKLCQPDESLIAFDGYGLLKILRISRKFRTETFYHFLHLTIQEWLAAHYLAQCTDSDTITWLGQNYQDPRYRVVIQFFCGINQFQSPSLRLLVPKIKINFSVFTWVFEGQWEKGCEKIATETSAALELGRPSIRLTLQPYECMVIFFVLKHSNTLWKLIFTNTQLTDQAIEMMGEEFTTLPNLLHSLTLEKMNIQLDTAIMLGKVVQSQLKLTCLTLTQTDLDDTTMTAFCEALVDLLDHKTLQNFDVSRNNLTAAGALSLSSLLPKLSALTHFNVSHNNIGVEGYNYIVNAVNKMENCPLQVLQLPLPNDDASMLSSLISEDIQLKNM